ncbi:MAG: glycine--tRNA ligase subunit beta, partial [Veillonella sp.]|nr:glycine--tRNA ligase subunit beta [Veillonella sp.]
MAKNFVFEIGSEEIPAGFMPSILRQLKELTTKALDEAHLSYVNVETLGTPRRLTVLVSDLEEQAADVTEEHKGPSVQIAFDADGNATKAAIGFAKGKGLDVTDLVTKDGYIYATTTTKGLTAEDVLKDTLPKLITGLSFGKSMRWGDLDDKFVRPLRWMVALLD